MIFRLSQKLATKLGIKPSQSLPLDPNPFADWSAHLFTVQRTQFVIFMNTASHYSTFIYVPRTVSDSDFLERAVNGIREFLEADGQPSVFRHFIAPGAKTIRFSKALNPSITGSMNDLVFHAKFRLNDGELSLHEISLRLNDMPMSSIDYRNPREAFKSLKFDQQVTDSGDE